MRLFIIYFSLLTILLVAIHPDPVQARYRNGALLGIPQDVAISEDGNSIAVATTTGVWLIEIDSGNGAPIVTPVAETTEPQQSVAFVPHTNQLVTGDLSRHVNVWDIASGRLVARWELYEAPSRFGPRIYVEDIKFNADGSRFVTIGAQGQLHLWNGETFNLIAPLRSAGGSAGTVDNLTFDMARDRVMAVSTILGYLDIWDMQTGQHVIAMQEWQVTDIDVQPENYVISINNGELWKVDPETFTVTEHIKGLEEFINYIPHPTSDVVMFSGDWMEPVYRVLNPTYEVVSIGSIPADQPWWIWYLVANQTWWLVTFDGEHSLIFTDPLTHTTFTVDGFGE